jgi:hypothetical protein
MFIVPLAPTLPTLLIVTPMAPGAFQESDVDCPLFIVFWPMLMVGGILSLTAIVIVDDAGLPDLPFAVNL